jgi:alpha-beta hydrolase superfamily lysophospholipase
MPVLIVGAGRDILIPPRLLRRLYRALAGRANQLEVMKGARHSFDVPMEMQHLESIVAAFLCSFFKVKSIDPTDVT